jgi:adenosylmethionine-8-amino-7-oxononanoate aminotransferase
MSHIIYPTTNLTATEKLVIERGEGVYVYDNQGKQYLEGLAGLWCTPLGYGNEEVIETAAQQMRKLTYSHMFGGNSMALCPPLIISETQVDELVEKLGRALDTTSAYVTTEGLLAAAS